MVVRDMRDWCVSRCASLTLLSVSKNTCLFFYLCGDPIVMANLGTVAENREETVFVSKLSFVAVIKKNVMS